MKDNLNDKIVVTEMAGADILVNNPDANFDNELIELGFRKNGKYYSLNMPVDDMPNRASLIKNLIKLGAIFSYGHGWSPSELVDYYRSMGLVEGKYYMISWKGANNFLIELV